jgi:hypothetical protein
MSADSWVVCEAAGVLLTRTLMASGEFTVRVLLAPSRLDQGGPARIFSLSIDAGDRNLTLAQEYTSLVVRLRNHITGLNGRSPELLVPNALPDTAPRTLLLSYDGAELRLWSAGRTPSAALRYTPGLAFFQRFMRLEQPYVRNATLMYLFLLFSSLGVMLGLGWSLATGKPARALVLAGVFAAPLGFVCLVAALAGVPAKMPDAAFALVFILAGFGLVRWIASRPRLLNALLPVEA